MAEGMRPTAFNPIPWSGLAPHTSAISIAKYTQDSGRRMGSGGRGQGGSSTAGGDRPPVVPSQSGGVMPWAYQPGPVYGLRQGGSPLQTVRQPYRHTAGMSVQYRAVAQRLPAHMFAGPKSLGQPVTNAITQQVAALLALRSGQKSPVPQSSITGTGIGSVSGGMMGAAFNPIRRS